jgi:alkanesulfonate monooxygenase SsuD/methylene tetrahydromethanopterin reductase-like flavin-dependent oxidoreductase (luciferase family)
VLAGRPARLDQLSGGRLLIGFGQRWMTHEFSAGGQVDQVRVRPRLGHPFD